MGGAQPRRRRTRGAARCGELARRVCPPRADARGTPGPSPGSSRSTASPAKTRPCETCPVGRPVDSARRHVHRVIAPRVFEAGAADSARRCPAASPDTGVSGAWRGGRPLPPRSLSPGTPPPRHFLPPGPAVGDVLLESVCWVSSWCAPRNSGGLFVDREGVTSNAIA